MRPVSEIKKYEMNIIRIQGDNEKRFGVYYEFDKDSRPLGEGGMGRIYKGFRVDMRTGIRIQVAIKAVNENNQSSELLERARREASIQIENENLMKMYGFVENHEQLPSGAWVKRYYMPMELLIGVNLDDLLRGITTDQNGLRIPYAEELYSMFLSNKVKAIGLIGNAILAGIMALHNKGFIHRDIDPSNVMITIDGKIKLIDFGICKQICTLATSDKSLTASGTFIGKVNYAAPELVLGDVKNQNATTDIYAIGVLIYQLYTGTLPFVGSDAEVLASHLNKKMPLNLIQHSGLRKIVAKATDKKQGNRYQSAAEMIVDIERMPISISAPHPIPWKYIGGVAASVIVVVAALLLILNKPDEPPPPPPTVAEQYQIAKDLIAYNQKDSIEKGYESIKVLAKDSLYASAIMDYYERVMDMRDSLHWREAYELVEALAAREMLPEALYECAMYKSFISPKLDLPEVERYSLGFVEDDLIAANRIFETIIKLDPDNYRAIFWSLINYIKIGEPNIYGEKMAELLYDKFSNVAATTDDPAFQIYLNVIKDLQLYDVFASWNLNNKYGYE